MVAWPDDLFEDFAWWSGSADSLTSYLKTQRIFIMKNSSITMYDVIKYYSPVIALFNQWIGLSINNSLTESVWIRGVSYYQLLAAYSFMSNERSFGLTYYLNGSLPWQQFLLLEKARIQLENRINIARGLSQTITDLYEQIEYSSYHGDTDISASRGSMLNDNAIPVAVSEAVVWNKRYSYFMTSVKTLILFVGFQLQEAMMHDANAVDVPLLVAYCIVILVILAFLSPFAMRSGYSTISTLLAYALLMEKKTRELKREKRRTENLLNQMLPRFVAYRLKKGEFMDAEEYRSVTIFFSDIEDFADISARSLPMQIVGFLNDIYNLIDREIVKFDIYKVETIGCIYMVASGLPMRNGQRHVREIARFALELLRVTEQFVIPHMPTRKLQLRMGMHSGYQIILKLIQYTPIVKLTISYPNL